MSTHPCYKRELFCNRIEFSINVSKKTKTLTQRTQTNQLWEIINQRKTVYNSTLYDCPTGARVLYKYLPMCVGLRRMIFLKRTKQFREEYVGNYGFTYVLLCECFNLRESYIASACTTIDQLRARCCGYTALYINQRQ